MSDILCEELAPPHFAAYSPGLKFAFDRSSIFGLAKQLANDNGLYFRCISSSQFRHRFAIACDALSADISIVEALAQSIATLMLKYDYDAKTPGNGLRSIVSVADSCVLHLVRLLRDVKEQREYLLFRTNYFCKELEAYRSVLSALRRDFRCVTNNLHLWKSSDELFATDDSQAELDTLMNLVETYDHSCFYGRCMGFQFASSLYRVFQVVGFGLASYSILWERGPPDSIAQTVTNLYQSGRFALNPEERAQRIVDVIMNADITFCKSFWNLTEGPFLQDVPKWFCPTLAVNEVWTIPAKNSILVASTTEGLCIKITPPTVHSGPAPISIRVLSHEKREGMSNPYADSTFGNSVELPAPKSPNLLLHCHGGGFIATSSKSHEMYLRHWTKHLDCTIVSVDYSLAPEHPYPRAVEEVLYTYAWVMENADRLGWTGERICFAGDSAGGHILMSITLRAIQMTMRRLADGLVLIYSPFLVEYSPSPSRLLSFLDPLLPPGIMARCIAAYLGATETVSNKEGCIVKSPLTSSRSTLAEYAFNLNQQTSRTCNKPAEFNFAKCPSSGNLPEYELNLGNAIGKHCKRPKDGTPVAAEKTKLRDVSGVAGVEKTPLKIGVEQNTSSKGGASIVGGDDKIISFCNLRGGSVAVTDRAGRLDEGNRKDTPNRQNLGTASAENPSLIAEKVQFSLEPSTPESPAKNRVDGQDAVSTLSAKEDSAVEIQQPRPIISRQRSQSDTVVDFSMPTQKRLRMVDESDEMMGTGEGAEMTDEMASVRIRKDPRRIVVSSGSYDIDFLDYLNHHEFINKSFVRLRVPYHSGKTSKAANSNDPSCDSMTPKLPPLLPLAGRRSRSTSSLTTQIGEKLGVVTNYVLDGLSFFMDTPTASIDAEPPDSPSSFILSNDAIIGGLQIDELNDGSIAPPSTPASAPLHGRQDAAADRGRYGDVGASRLAHFHRLEVPRDPVLSPLRADDDLLAKLPRVSLVACHLDPLLDDSITFAKRLRKNNVRLTVDLLDSVPHGFLNFTIFSPECRQGAKQCMERIRDVFENK